MQRITNTYSCWRRRRSSSSFSDRSRSAPPPPVSSPTPPRSDDASDGLGLAGRMLLVREECAPAAAADAPDVEQMLSRLPATAPLPLLPPPIPRTGPENAVGLGVAAAVSQQTLSPLQQLNHNDRDAADK